MKSVFLSLVVLLPFAVACGEVTPEPGLSTTVTGGSGPGKSRKAGATGGAAEGGSGGSMNPQIEA
jgi:hypothetical protein